VPVLDENGGEVVAIDRLVRIRGQVAGAAEPVGAEPLGELGGDATCSSASRVR
jgi:hypothetical protein